VTPEPVDAQLCFALHAASRAMTAAYREPLSRLGLTYSQYLVLLVLWEQGEISVSTLGERLLLDSGTLSPLLKRLEARGILQRRHDAGDERRVNVRLTADGHALADDVAEVQRCVVAGSSLSREDALQLRALARTVAGLPT
jgi:DNA-binding MarR family transcriptional regulator